MADQKITQLTATTTLDDTDITPVVTDVSTTPTNKKITVANLKTQLNNISSANATDLTDSGDSSLHYHSADRNTDNHSSGTTNKVYTATEQTKLSGIETSADVTDAGNVGSAIGGTSEDATPADADKFAQAGGTTLAHTTWGTIKSLIQTALASVFAPIANGVTNGDSHDHSGGDGAQIAYANVSGTPTIPTKATGAELDTGTDDAKFATAKALADSGYATETYANTKIAKATNVTAITDTGIADGEIAVFNLTNKDIRTSDKTIVTSLGADDTTVPTSKAVADAITAGGGYTDENAQDAVGAMIADTATVDLTYTDATPELKADVKDGSITYAKLQDVSATARVLGRVTAGSGDAEEIVIDTDLSSVSANDDTIPSAKATKAYADTMLPLAGGTMTGNITLGENTAIAYDPVLSADGKYTGITRTGTAGATLAFGDLVYLDPTDSKWELADANIAAGSDGDPRGILGICVLAANEDAATNILLHGVVRADTAFPTLTVNAPAYVSETAGDIVVTQPTTTDVVIRVVGFGLTGDELFFNPSNDYITHT